MKKRKIPEDDKPILLAPIQGGNDKSLREKCAQGLIDIGFEAYGFGGWPIDSETGDLNLDILKFTADLMPAEAIKFALRVGSVEGLVEGVKMGYNIFDCVLPTRDARHKRLYVFSHNPEKIVLEKEEKFWEYLFIGREAYYRDNRPIEEWCDCHTCRNYSRAYLHHLFGIEDALAWRLATIHNLRFYSRLMELLAKNI